MKVKRENGMNMKKREEVEEQIKREEGAAGSDEGLSSVRRSSLLFVEEVKTSQSGRRLPDREAGT